MKEIHNLELCKRENFLESTKIISLPNRPSVGDKTGGAAAGATAVDPSTETSEESTDEKLDRVTNLLTRVLQLEEEKRTQESVKMMWDQGNTWKYTPPDA